MFSWITARDIFYGVVILGILGMFLGYSAHERSVGAAKIRAAGDKAAAAAVIHKGEVEKRAQDLIAPQVAAYKALLLAPPAHDAPRLRCVAAKSSAHVSADGGTGPGADAGANQSGSGSQDFDPGPAIDKLLQDDDAHVRTLEQYIRDCQAIGVCKK